MSPLNVMARARKYYLNQRLLKACIVHLVIKKHQLGGHRLFNLNAVKLETWKLSSMPTLFLLNFIKIIKLF
jgi:hypothetical protein